MADGWDVAVLSRGAGRADPGVRVVSWDGKSPGAWAAELEDAAALVNMTGRSIACLHTAENRRQIVESRIDAVRALDAALERVRRRPAVWVQASAIGIYGDGGDRVFTEQDPAAGKGFLPEVCRAWEHALFGKGSLTAPRRIALRTGFVLAAEGGGLPPLVRVARRFLGGAAGSGRQYLSWIHIQDAVGAIQWLIEQPSSAGAYTLCAPAPATNAEFMRELRRVLRRPWCPPAPAFVIRFLARRVLHVEPGLILEGTRAAPARLIAEGYEFRFASLREALGNVV